MFNVKNRQVEERQEYKVQEAMHDFDLTATIQDDIVYLVDKSSGIRAINLKSKNIDFNVSIDKLGSFSLPFVNHDGIFIQDNINKFYAINKSDGSVRWKYDAGGYINPALTETVGYLGCHDKCVYALDLNSGIVLWKHEVDSPIQTINIDNGYVFLGSEKYFYCLE